MSQGIVQYDVRSSMDVVMSCKITSVLLQSPQLLAAGLQLKTYCHPVLFLKSPYHVVISEQLYIDLECAIAHFALRRLGTVAYLCGF